LNDRITDPVEKADFDPDQLVPLEKLLGKDYEVIRAEDGARAAESSLRRVLVGECTCRFSVS